MREKGIEQKLVKGVKTPGKKPRPLQVSRHKILKRLGCRVFVLDDVSEIEKILWEMGGDAE